MDINKSINHFMAQQGYIQMDLSRHSKLHPSTISLIRNSHRTPSLDTVQALMDQMTDFERGEYDCIHGHDAVDGASDEYNRGYGEQYAFEQQAGALR